MMSVASIFFGVLVWAQNTYKIQGKVIDSDNQKPVSNTKIIIGNTTAITNNRGNFEITLSEGKYTLKALNAHFSEFQEEVDLYGNLKLNIHLLHKPEDIEAVVLNVKHQPKGTSVMSTVDKDFIDQHASENLGNLLSNISGVSSLKTGNNISKPIIHGMYGSRISILNNGVKMTEQEWGVEHAPNVESSNYQHIDVVKGASTLKYGGQAMGGVVVLEPAVYPRKDTLIGDASLTYQTNGRGGNTKVGLAKVWENGWVVNARGSYSKLGDLKTPNYYLNNTGQENSSFNFGIQKKNAHSGFSLDYYLTQQVLGISRASHIGSLQDFYDVVQAGKPLVITPFSHKINHPKQEVTHHLVKLKAYQDFENFGKLSATYSFQLNQRKEYDIRRGDLSNIASLDLELITHQLNVNHLKKWDKSSLETGIDAEYQNNYNNPKTLARRLVPNYDRYAVGAYSIYKYRFSKDWSVEASVRYDYNRDEVYKWYDTSEWKERFASQYSHFEKGKKGNRTLVAPKMDYHNLSFNVGTRYAFSDNSSITFNYAKTSRKPNIAELYSDGLHHSASVIERGDLGLKNENAHQLNLSFQTQLPILDGLGLVMNPYFLYSDGYVNQIPVGVQNTIRGVFPVWEYQQVKAQLWGVDVDIYLKLNQNIIYEGKAAYVQGEDRTHHRALEMMVPPNFMNSLQWKNPKWKDFFVKLENKTSLRQNRFYDHPIEITLYDAQGEAYQAKVDFSTPPPAYSIWGLQSGINISKHFSAVVSVQNIFDKEYRDYLNRLRFFGAETGSNFIFTLQYKF